MLRHAVIANQKYGMSRYLKFDTTPKLLSDPGAASSEPMYKAPAIGAILQYCHPRPLQARLKQAEANLAALEAAVSTANRNLSEGNHLLAAERQRGSDLCRKVRCPLLQQAAAPPGEDHNGLKCLCFQEYV